MAGKATGRKDSGPKVGQYRAGKTERWNGYKWVKVNVVHRGQKATLGGEPVTADGRGNWVGTSKTTSRRNRTTKRSVKGRYAPGERVTTTPLQPIPASRRPKDMQSGKVYGDAGQPPAPTLPPKPTPTRIPSRSKPTQTAKPAEKKPADKPTKRTGRTWLADNYKPGKPHKSTAGKAKNKPKQSERMREALKTLKVRDYKKKKKR